MSDNSGAPKESGRPGNVADYRFAFESESPDTYRVRKIEGVDGLSRLFTYRVDLVCGDDTEEPQETVGRAVVLEISGAAGSRQIFGIVREWNFEGVGVHVLYYSAEIVPPHWMLTHRFCSRVFRAHMCSDMTVTGILKQVLKDAGFPDTALRVAASGSYPARDFVVQYRETDMDFVSRLLEEEGIFYFLVLLQFSCPQNAPAGPV